MYVMRRRTDIEEMDWWLAHWVGILMHFVTSSSPFVPSRILKKNK
jgi:hypothetical protein